MGPKDGARCYPIIIKDSCKRFPNSVCNGGLCMCNVRYRPMEVGGKYHCVFDPNQTDIEGLSEIPRMYGGESTDKALVAVLCIAGTLALAVCVLFLRAGRCGLQAEGSRY